MSDLSHSPNSNSTEKPTDTNLSSNFSWEHPYLKMFGFAFGDICSFIVLLTSEGGWAKVALGMVVAFTIAFIYSSVLAIIESRRRERLTPISVVPATIENQQKMVENLPSQTNENFRNNLLSEVDFVTKYVEVRDSRISTKTPKQSEKQETVLQPTIRIEPFEEPTFTEGFDVVKFTIGGAEATYHISLLEGNKIPFPVNFIKAYLYIEDNKPYIDIDIYDVHFEIPVRLRHNKLMNKPEDWDMNSDKTALEVINEKQEPVFQLYYKTVSHIVGLSGILCK